MLRDTQMSKEWNKREMFIKGIKRNKRQKRNKKRKHEQQQVLRV